MNICFSHDTELTSPVISRVFSGASVANVKRRCILILQLQTFAADVPLKTRPQGKPPVQDTDEPLDVCS